MLGKGAQACVFLGQDAETQEYLAVKEYNLHGIGPHSDFMHHLRKEINVMEKLKDHSNVVRLHAVIDQKRPKLLKNGTTKEVKVKFMVLDLCNGGDLSLCIKSRPNNRLAERDC